MLSSQQAVVRDLAPRVPMELPYTEVEAAVQAADIVFLEEYRLTDLYRGAPLPESVKSLTLSFTFAFQPYWTESEGKKELVDLPLTEQEVNEALTRIRAELEARCQATFPG